MENKHKQIVCVTEANKHTGNHSIAFKDSRLSLSTISFKMSNGNVYRVSTSRIKNYIYDKANHTLRIKYVDVIDKEASEKAGKPITVTKRVLFHLIPDRWIINNAS